MLLWKLNVMDSDGEDEGTCCACCAFSWCCACWCCGNKSKHQPPCPAEGELTITPAEDQAAAEAEEVVPVEATSAEAVGASLET